MTEYVGTGEIHRQHGLDRVQVFRLIKAGDWPEPVVELARGRVWDKAEIAARMKLLRKAGRVTKQNEIVPWRYLDKGNYARRVKLRPWAQEATTAARA